MQSPKRTTTDLQAGSYWRKLLIEYDVDGDITYLAQHVDPTISDTDTSHMVKKFTMDVFKNITKIQTLPGSWTNRISLGW
jgi:hypothetical protein